jgi:hypothetical protein
MKRILPIIITLSLLLGLALWSVGRGVHAKTVAAPVVTAAYPLNPSNFASLGASPFTSAGTYSLDASKNNPAPTLSGPGIAVPIAGVFFSPSGGTVANDEIAVFTFNSLNVPAGVLIGHAANANSRPVALLAHGSITIDGTVNVGGSNGSGLHNGGNAGPGGGGGGGGGGNRPGSGGLGFVNGANGSLLDVGDGGSVVVGGGGTSGHSDAHGGGGAFGGNGGNSIFNGIGGTAYGDLALTLQGGSGGAGGGTTASGTGGGGGGGGGGAVEIGALGNITLGGTVLANGGAGTRNLGDGGGGAGGGILVHAPTVSLSGNLNAIGGGSFPNGGGGGGGRVLILTADGTLADGSLATNVNVSGGTGYRAGGSGVKQLGIGIFNHAPVAQCQSVTVAAGANCTANASINNGSYDPDSDTFTLAQSPAGPYALGTTSVELTVTDSQGAASSCMATVTVVDQTAPTLSCPANVVVTLPPNTMNTGMVVNYPAPTATDNCSTLPTITSSPGSGSIFPVGVTTVNVTAKDAANNQAACRFTVTVRYNFSGFFQPVDNAPTVNAVTAGQAIPVKFSLSGNKGLNIFAAGYPQSVQVACSGGTPDDIEETVTAGASSLSYDATTDQYKYVWKTDKAWKGTCRKLILKFNDGSTREALFQFK